MLGDNKEVHVFTDYRWNDGSVVRRWMVDPDQVDLENVVLHQFSLSDPDENDQ